MLVLSRRVGESTRLGKDIKVHVLGINGNQVRIGFEAPDEVTILRSELVGTAPKGNRNDDREIQHRSVR